jgi:hypothetical protein
MKDGSAVLSRPRTWDAFIEPDAHRLLVVTAHPITPDPRNQAQARAFDLTLLEKVYEGS